MTDIPFTFLHPESSLTLLLLSAISAAISVALNVWLSNAYASRIYASIADLPGENTPRDGSRRVAIV